MSNQRFQRNSQQANFDLLEDWFEECDRFSRKNDLDDDDQLEKLVEILNDDELTRQIYEILENSNYHEQVGDQSSNAISKYDLEYVISRTSLAFVCNRLHFTFMISLFDFINFHLFRFPDFRTHTSPIPLPFPHRPKVFRRDLQAPVQTVFE